MLVFPGSRETPRRCVTNVHANTPMTKDDALSRPRTLLVLLAAFGAAPFVAPAAPYPGKPVRIIVPAPTDSRSDRVARLVSPLIGAHFSEQFLVDNRSGSAGLLGTEIAARAKPDGYTLVVGSPSTLTTTTFRRVETPYDVIKDFAPIGIVAVSPFVLTAHPTVPAADMNGLLSFARITRGKLTYGAITPGGTAVAAMELLQTAAKIDFKRQGYPVQAQLIGQLLSGNVSIGMLDIFDALDHVRARRLRPIAVTSSRRSTALPQVPTAAESGLSGFDATKWTGLLAPARTPTEIVSELSIGLRRALLNPGVRWQLGQEGMLPGDGDAAAFAVRLQREIEIYGKLKKPLVWP
jgi:tripartite-type tricarboxylate transporter receptor subunit TctC